MNIRILWMLGLPMVLLIPFRRAQPLRLHPLHRSSFRYTVIDLGALPDCDVTFAHSINDQAQIVGDCYKYDPDSSGQELRGRAFLWDHGKMRYLPTFGGFCTQAWALNDRGDVAGNADTTAHLPLGAEPALWPKNRSYDPQRLLVGSKVFFLDGVAYGINAQGDIVGSDRRPGGIYKNGDRGGRESNAFLWRNGALLNLHVPQGMGSCALGINDRGDVVGYFGGSGYRISSSEEKACLWRDGHLNGRDDPVDTRPAGSGLPREHHAFFFQNGNFVALKTLGGKFSAATALNTDGTIVGWACTQQGQKHACSWGEGLARDLGTLGGPESEALAINDQGVIVGEALNSQDQSCACLWQGETAVDLNTLIPPHTGWILYGATGINARGQIIGYGEQRHRHRAFLLTPVPVDKSDDGPRRRQTRSG